MLRATRELIAGLATDPQFGTTVMLGVGGILAEAVADVDFRLVPITRVDAEEMVADLRLQALLGPFRGEPAVDRDAVAGVLVALSDAAGQRPDDRVGRPQPAADRRRAAGGGRRPGGGGHREPDRQRRRVPRPCSSPAACWSPAPPPTPASSGSSASTTSWPRATRARSSAPTATGPRCSACRRVADVADLPDGETDLVFVCTPAAANPDLLRACAKKGITAAFIASAGYGEAGEAGRAAQADLVALADELGILLAGPNGQGVVSPPAKLCAQIVAPFPPAGHIAIASQSGNFVSSFENYARRTGVGVSRAVSAGNAAAVGVADYLGYYADDPETRVSLAYVESVGDGRAFYERLRELAERKPIVLVKGGATAGGQRAAASHTGALATDDAVFDGDGPPGGRHPGGHGRAGVRGRGHLRLPAAAPRRPGRGGHDRRRLGRGRRRRAGRHLARAGAAARRPAGRHRRGAAAPLEPQQPDRHGRRRDPRHRPQGPRPGGVAPRHRRRAVPRHRHPVEPGDASCGRGRSTPTTASSGSSPTTSARTPASPKRRSRSASAPASRSSWPPSWPSPPPTTPAPPRCGPAGRLCYPSADRAVAALDHLRRRARWLERRGLA